MAKDIRLPKLGQTMEEGTVVRCLVNVGDEVKRDQVLFEIETDKATMEMESPVDGFVKNIFVNVSQTLPVNDPMMVIGDKDEQVSQSYIDSLFKGAIIDAVEQTTGQSNVVGVSASPASAKIIEVQKLGQTMEEGTIVNCRVKVGDEIKRGDVVFEIETDKATMEMESSVSGFVKVILVEIGQTVPVGSPLVVVADKDELIPQSYIDALKSGQPVSAAEIQQSSPVVASSPHPPAATGTAASSVTETVGRIFASPRAKMAAKGNGVALADITGTGPGGRIVEKDVTSGAGRQKRAVSQAVASGPQAGSEVPLTKMRRAIGSNLQRSWQQSPHFNVTMSITMTQAMSFREHYNRNRQKPQQISVNDLVVKACAMTLKQYPAVNSKLADDKIVYHSGVNIGIAAAVAEGLVVPVLVDADKLSWDQMQTQTKQLVAEARNGKIVGMGKGTFTISNLGMFGVDHFTAIVNPPECAILAVGAVIDKVVAINKMIAIAPMMQVTLCSDHRIIDGAVAAQFLKSFKEYLEEKILDEIKNS
ncbi:MAG: 2-oxo acid dehydrogenase subunit E2 [Sedimentisphaerales bacterium]|nr:2-oxo acid dehydrogenase subunit E2 [Sedimentisphaerales bacterium]